MRSCFGVQCASFLILPYITNSFTSIRPVAPYRTERDKERDKHQSEHAFLSLLNTRSLFNALTAASNASSAASRAAAVVAILAPLQRGTVQKYCCGTMSY